jgi:non-specific serine/threonine protein kinase
LEAYRDGVWLVDLSPISEADLIPSTVAGVIGVAEQVGVPLVDTLIAHLKPLRTLLVLDNCEHLVDGAADIAETLLRACPELRMAATSRERLGVEGEVTWRVPPLSLAGTDELAGSYGESEAARLFVARARTHQPDFRLTDENLSAVHQICRRLDGIPLAIELAAARAHVMGVKDILARLEDGFRLPYPRTRAGAPRQRTLRAAMDWSHDLMTVEEQSLFRRLTVFAGGFTLEAAEQVCAASVDERDTALDLLSKLVDKSLVIAEEGRYHFLETVREYGRERLALAGEENLLPRRHAAYFLLLAEPRAPGGTVAWVESVEREHDNMRAALRWSLDADPAVGVRLAHALYDFWNLRGHATEARQVLEQVVQRAADDPELLATAHLDAGSFAYLQGDPVAARAHLTESLKIARATADDESAARALRVLGVLTMAHDDPSVGKAYMEESLALWRRLGNPAEEAELLHQLGVLANLDRDAPAARTLFEQSLGIRTRLGRREEAGMTLAFLAAVELRLGDVDSARTAVRESLALCRELGDRRAAWSIDVLACVEAAVGEHDVALQLEGASAAIHRSAGTSTPRSWQAVVATWLDAAHVAVDHDTSVEARRRGEEMSFDDALQFAVSVAAGKPDRMPRQRGSLR